MPNLFPTFNLPTITPRSAPTARRYYQSPYFDFESGDFVFEPSGKIKMATGREAFEQWCLKVCMTERGTRLAYSTDIGTEFEAAMKMPSVEAVKSSVVRTITESIMCHPCAEWVKNFVFRAAGDSLWVTFDVKGRDWAESSTLTVKY